MYHCVCVFLSAGIVTVCLHHSQQDYETVRNVEWVWTESETKEGKNEMDTLEEQSLLVSFCDMLIKQMMMNSSVTNQDNRRETDLLTYLRS